MSITIVAFSDTHQLHDKLLDDFPEGDILIFAGDMCNYGNEREVIRFCNFLKKLPHPYKIIVAGNHDRLFETSRSLACSFLPEEAIYLENSSCNILGIKIYGSPWTPAFCNWSFNATEEQQFRFANYIPEDLDILVTHGPPHTILDKVSYLTKNNNQVNEYVGCPHLLNRVELVKPRYHIFGHIHPNFGRYENKDTVFYNVSNCNIHKDAYRLENQPITFKINPK